MQLAIRVGIYDVLKEMRKKEADEPFLQLLL